MKYDIPKRELILAVDDSPVKVIFELIHHRPAFGIMCFPPCQNKNDTLFSQCP